MRLRIPALRHRADDGHEATELLDLAWEALGEDDAESAAKFARRAERCAEVPADRAEALALRAEAAIDLEDFEAATSLAHAAATADPGCIDAWDASGHAAYRSADFVEAVAHWGKALELDSRRGFTWHRMGHALLFPDGELDRGLAALRRAAALEPGHFVVPTPVSTTRFEQLVQDAYDGIPEQFRRRVDAENITIASALLPDVDEIREGLEPDVLGYFQGSGTFSSVWSSMSYPQRIVIFQRNLEIVSPDEATLNEEVRRTVLHEVGHYFGMSHGDMEGTHLVH